MSESQASRSRICRNLMVITDLDMAAAQQLLQLSDEDNSPTNSCTERKKEKSKNKKRKFVEYRDCDHGSRSSSSSHQVEITSKVIEEIFGKEEVEEEVLRPRKRKYRSLLSIYKEVPRLSIAGEGKVR
ncbi:hypothetical protein Tsubulata_029182 [Turnera subulata]|uniref:Uncharacterized protein n=1 Tax=Turnera subulata TaxID=218843 RepID=A0A9Q0FLV3_9ROSI|nr:hypothetical protein Tsubulata_029182 [Turnera subulata]